MDRWTKSDLNSLNDLDFAICILNERRNKLTNPCSPLYTKLSNAVNQLERFKKVSNRKETLISVVISKGRYQFYVNDELIASNLKSDEVLSYISHYQSIQGPITIVRCD